MAKKPKKVSVHYVDNKKFLQAMKDWKEECREAEEADEEDTERCEEQQRDVRGKNDTRRYIKGTNTQP